MGIFGKIKGAITPKQKPISAFDAYSMTRYGIISDKETLCNTCVAEIKALMQSKSMRNLYSLTFDLDENLPELGEYLVNYYSELGFNCFVLDASIDSRIGSPMLYLSWHKKGTP